MTGTLLGIARKARPRAVPETVERAAVGLAFGIEGDHRGSLKPGGRRQVTAMTLADWQAAIAELGEAGLVWSDRRVNLLVDGDLPRAKGTRLRIGSALFEVTGECDPCHRMDAIRPGLRAALTPDWRGGRLLRVLADGHVAIGDMVTIEMDLAEEV